MWRPICHRYGVHLAWTGECVRRSYSSCRIVCPPLRARISRRHSWSNRQLHMMCAASRWRQKHVPTKLAAERAAGPDHDCQHTTVLHATRKPSAMQCSATGVEMGWPVTMLIPDINTMEGSLSHTSDTREMHGVDWPHWSVACPHNYGLPAIHRQRPRWIPQAWLKHGLVFGLSDQQVVLPCHRCLLPLQNET